MKILTVINYLLLKIIFRNADQPFPPPHPTTTPPSQQTRKDPHIHSKYKYMYVAKMIKKNFLFSSC